MSKHLAQLGVALVVAVGPGQPPARSAEKPAAVDLGGEWRFNKELSSAQRPKPPAGSEPPRDSESPEAGATLKITQTDQAVVVQETPGQTQTFYPNGRTYKADDGASNVKSQWKDGALVVEKKNTSGWRLTQTWTLAPDGKRLTLDWRLEGGPRPRMALKRVYDRVEPGP